MEVTDPVLYTFSNPTYTGRCLRDANWYHTTSVPLNPSGTPLHSNPSSMAPEPRGEGVRGNCSTSPNFMADHTDIRGPHLSPNQTQHCCPCCLYNRAQTQASSRIPMTTRNDPQHQKSTQGSKGSSRDAGSVLRSSLTHLKQLAQSRKRRVKSTSYEWENNAPLQTRHHRPCGVEPNCECSSTKSQVDKHSYCRQWLEDASYRLSTPEKELTVKSSVCNTTMSDHDSAIEEEDTSPEAAEWWPCQNGTAESASDHSYPFGSSDSSALSHPSEVDCTEAEDLTRRNPRDPFPYQVSRRPELRTTSHRQNPSFSWENYHHYYNFPLIDASYSSAPCHSNNDDTSMLLHVQLQRLNIQSRREHQPSHQLHQQQLPYRTSAFPHSNVIPPPNHNPFAKK